MARVRSIFSAMKKADKVVETALSKTGLRDREVDAGPSRTTFVADGVELGPSANNIHILDAKYGGNR